MLKEFMLTNLIPQRREGDAKMLYLQDPMRAAVIMLSVCKQHSIRLSDAEEYRLCTALCLPNRSKEDFFKYWTDFSQDVPFLKK